MSDEPCTAKQQGGTSTCTDRALGPWQRAAWRRQTGCAAACEPWDLAANAARRISKATMIAVLALQPAGLAAQDISGVARASDGDTLTILGISVRLFGIDAPELAQNCTRGGTAWACGKEAADRLAALVAEGPTRCEQRDTDVYGRPVSICYRGSVDLSAAMVDAGLAIALSDFTPFYDARERRARDARIGLWGGEFQRPSAYRGNNPARPVGDVHDAPVPRLMPAPRRSGVYFRGCNEARAAGAAPILRGQPGYRPGLDGDGDGIACEPYQRR